MGISGIDIVEYSWKSKKKDGGARIDMLIGRKDDVINVCEMKYSDDIFIIDNAYRSDLIHKEEVFKYETDINKAVYITLVTVNGLRVNEYSDVIQNVITGDDLFVE